MATHREDRNGWTWRCLQCRGTLAPDGLGLSCADCGKQYPVISDIPILVREPSQYLRSELTSLERVSREALRRRETLETLERDAGLSEVSIRRHRDTVDADIARAETFLALLEPVGSALTESSRGSLGTLGSGWTLEALIPFLLRDWTSTSELDGIGDRVGAALENAFADIAERSIVLPACGTAGLLAKLAPKLGSVLGFDLTLPALMAARELLDGKSLDLALPRSISPTGRIVLRGDQSGLAGPHVTLAAMDAFDTAFADGSVDCVVTAFLVDLIGEPLRLADEIHRILRDDGVWINYGPSGPVKALWRFDQAESAAFFEAAGFSVMNAEAFRTTHLDVSRDCPSWSFRNHICYLTSARKTGQAPKRASSSTSSPAELAQIVPRHFPGAQLVQRHRLGADETHTTLRHERLPSRVQSIEISNEAARLVAFVDGKRTVAEIAEMFKPEMPGVSTDDVIQAFTHYFEEGLLDWRDQ